MFIHIYKHNVYVYAYTNIRKKYVYTYIQTQCIRIYKHNVYTYIQTQCKSIRAASHHRVWFVVCVDKKRRLVQIWRITPDGNNSLQYTEKISLEYFVLFLFIFWSADPCTSRFQTRTSVLQQGLSLTTWLFVCSFVCCMRLFAPFVCLLYLFVCYICLCVALTQIFVFLLPLFAYFICFLFVCCHCLFVALIHLFVAFV